VKIAISSVPQNPPPNFASGGQKPFREKVSGLPKAFYNQKFLRGPGACFTFLQKEPLAAGGKSAG